MAFLTWSYKCNVIFLTNEMKGSPLSETIAYKADASVIYC